MVAVGADVDARDLDARCEVAFESSLDEHLIIRARTFERAERFSIVMMVDEARGRRGASREKENENENETEHEHEHEHRRGTGHSGAHRFASHVSEMPNVSSWSVTSAARVT